MEYPTYPLPASLHAIPASQLDLRPDADVDAALQRPAPVTSAKNVWFFWHAGFARMHPYTQRNVRAWHRRLAKHGWTVRVCDRVPGSPSNIAKFLDVADPATFPRAFIDGRVGGDFAPQHTSDLVRFPLLLRYGGVYADVGLLLVGDLARLWDATLGNAASRYEVLSHGDAKSLMNYLLAAPPNNPLFERCHRLLLALWNADGGRTCTDGMHASPLLAGVPLLGGDFEIKEADRVIGKEESGRILTDYIIQGQAISMVMGLVDADDDWDGPAYVAEHVYAVSFIVGSQLINELTAWDGRKAWELLSLRLPAPGDPESDEQRQARDIVEQCLRRSFTFKLAHGLILKVFGETLGSLWRKHEGSDDVPGTYAHWLRQGMVFWTQDELPPCEEMVVQPPIKKGRLLEA